MNKHTPGPWRVGDAGATVFGPPRETLPPRIVANIDRRPIVPGEPRANAILIAAAPDLLAALEYIVAWSPDAEKWNAETARDKAAAAIAKAKGK